MTYPLSAVVGSDDLVLALQLAAVSPGLGGVLVRGEKGTAKSTAVRGLAALLPPVDVVGGCRFSCDPAAPEPDCPDGPHPADVPRRTRPARLVELPVGASEDRVTGSIDLDRALAEGVTALRPGLLASAHRGLLYVDEVNLLQDHIVDLLLDAAALGVAHVERDGVSVRHAARFLLVGTMNPEEGELRPQLLDRFGLTVEVSASRDIETRAEVVRRHLAYEADPAAFAANWANDEWELAERIAAARDRLGWVRIPEPALRQIAAVCAACDVDGMRADVVLAKAAIALAAWEGRNIVEVGDIRRAARLALPHRRRRGPFDAPGTDSLDTALDATLGEPGAGPDDDPPGGPGGPHRPDGGSGGGGGGQPGARGEDDGMPAGTSGPGHAGTAGSVPAPAHERTPTPAPSSGAPTGSAGSPASAGPAGRQPPAGSARRGPTGRCNDYSDRYDDGTGSGDGRTRPAGAPGQVFRPRVFEAAGYGRGASGRRSRARSPRGAVVAATTDAPGLHLPATLFAAAPHQAARGRAGTALVLGPADRRGPLRVGREGNLMLFVVDTSGSMAARARLAAVTTAVLSLLLDAYQRRDRVGMVTFRGTGADLVLPPTSSVDVGATRLASLPVGGRTPLAAGLERAADVLRAERRRDPGRQPLLVVVTDGRSTHGPDPLPVARALARTGAARPGVATAGRGHPGAARLASVVVDCESGYTRLGLAARLAEALGAATVPLDALPANTTHPTSTPAPARAAARRPTDMGLEAAS